MNPFFATQKRRDDAGKKRERAHRTIYDKKYFSFTHIREETAVENGATEAYAGRMWRDAGRDIARNFIH